MEQFTEREQALIVMLADLSDRRTKEEKSEAAGFNRKEVFRKQRSQDFRQAVIELARDNLAVDLAGVYRMLIHEACENKNIKAAELLLKATGEVQSGHNVNTTIHNAKDVAIDADRLEQWRKQRRESYDSTRPGHNAQEEN